MMKQKVDHRPMQAADLVSQLGRLRSDLTIPRVMGHIAVWLLVSLATFGIGALFWPYAAAKLIIDSVVITDESANSTARLQCKYKPGQQFGHVLFWAVLIFLSGGFGALFYPFSVAFIALNKTELLST